MSTPQLTIFPTFLCYPLLASAVLGCKLRKVALILDLLFLSDFSFGAR